MKLNLLYEDQYDDLMGDKPLPDQDQYGTQYLVLFVIIRPANKFHPIVAAKEFGRFLNFSGLPHPAITRFNKDNMDDSLAHYSFIISYDGNMTEDIFGWHLPYDVKLEHGDTFFGYATVTHRSIEKV